jgi:arsenate reductase
MSNTGNIIVYHNPRCSKSRCALDFLKEKEEAFEVVEYLKQVPTIDELTNIIRILGIEPFELVRKGEPIYKEQFKGKQLTDKQWVEAMVKFPKLIERPIVIKNSNGVIARPVERIAEIL